MKRRLAFSFVAAVGLAQSTKKCADLAKFQMPEIRSRSPAPGWLRGPAPGGCGGQAPRYFLRAAAWTA
jgi:hypothetical protein